MADQFEAPEGSPISPGRRKLPQSVHCNQSSTPILISISVLDSAIVLRFASYLPALFQPHLIYLVLFIWLCLGLVPTASDRCSHL
jgi:hypothetical protein